MISTASLEAEIVDLGQMIGLVDSSGNIRTAWFSHLPGVLETIFTDPTQRSGLINFLDALLPPAPLDGLPQGEEWHPLLGSDPSLRGNLYLTVNDSGASVVFGIAGDYSTSAATTPQASLRARLPLFSANSGIHAIAGTSNGPLSVDLRLTLGWTRPAQPIALQSVVVSAVLAPFASGGPTESLVVTLAGLDLDGSGAKDTILDPNQLGNEATHLILGLIQYELGQLSAGLSAEAQSVVDNLLPLLGLGDGIPAFPFLQIASDGQAIQKWFLALISGAAPPITKWLKHLTGLLGATAPVISGTGTPADPWTATVFTLNPSSSLNVTLANATGTASSALQIGIGLKIAPSGANPIARLHAQATIASIPLSGTGSASVLPSATVVIESPGADGAPPLVNNPPTIAVSSVRGGFAWNGSTLAPLLQLENVMLASTPYATLDLTNADSVVHAVEAAVLANITSALGAGAGQHLLALAGIAAPSGDPVGTPHLVDASVLVTNPARAIAAVHRAVLVDPADSWSYLFGDLTGLLGLAGPVTGTGTEADPWRVALGSAGPLLFEFCAWNAATAHGPGDVQHLRIGFRVSVTAAPFQFWWLAELLAANLPLNAEGSISVLAAQHAVFNIQPLPSLPPSPNFSVSADGITARMDWTPGGSMTWQAGVQNLQLTIGASPAIAIPTLAFPLPAIDVTNPVAVAAAFGVSIPNLELALRNVLARAILSWGGMPAYVTAALLGVHGNLAGLQADWPALADPAGPGSLLSDPLTALRNWLATIAVQVSADSSPFLFSGLDWLQTLLSGSLPVASTTAPTFDVSVTGSGTYDDPWALPLSSSNADPTQVVVWLEPQGPPASWATPLAAAATAAGDFSVPMQVAIKLAAFVPALRGALSQTDTGALASSLAMLATHLTSSDGVVPFSSQIPTGGTWQAGTAIPAPHSQQPTDPSAIGQILGQIDTWAGSGSRVVLLLGPAFSTHDIWGTLLATPLLHGTTAANTNFDFRTGDPNPQSVDLTTVTAVVDYYTADLQDDGTGNLTSLTGQIASVVARLGQLRPGVPVTLVAHSTAGVPARVFTSANQSNVRGLITLGTPHAGAPLPFLTDNGVADAVRFVQQLLPSIPAGPLLAALSHIVQAVDGYTAPATANAVAVKAPYPVGSFNFTGAGSTDTGTVHALALGGSLAVDLLASVKQALAAMSTAAAGAAIPAPTHIGIGLRCGLFLGSTATGAVDASASMRLDIFRVALANPPAAITRPEYAAHVRIRLSRPGDWLLGGASSYNATQGFSDVRVGWTELGLDITLNGAALSVIPHAALYQASFHGPMNTGVYAFTDAQTQPLLGAVFQGITAIAPSAASSLGGLLSALQSLGVAVADPHGGIGLSGDAWTALSVDAAGYLALRLAAALTSGIGGAIGPATGPWVFEIDDLPLELYVTLSPAKIGLRTAPAPTRVLQLASNASLGFEVGVLIPQFTATLTATFQVGAFTLSWSNGTVTAGAAPWLTPITLVPFSASAIEASLSNALPRLLLSGAFTAILEGVLGSGYQVPPIDTFFSSPGQTLQGSSALGSGSGLSAPKINQLLQIIAQVLHLPSGPGLNLPDNIQLIAEGTGTAADPTSLHLLTTAPLAGILSVDLSAAIDSSLNVTPSGQLTVTVPLPGSWTGISIHLGASSTAISLSIAPQLAGVSPIQILPTFSGLGNSLRGALEALLPQALDAVVNELGPPTPGTVLQGVLDVATAFGIYGAGGFAAFAQPLRDLTQGNFLAVFGGSGRAGVASAIANLFTIPELSGVPGTVTANAGKVTWSETFSGGISGTAAVTLGWDSTGPTAALSLSGVKLDSGGITASLSAGYASGALHCSANLGIALASTLGLDVSPTLRAALNGSSFRVTLLPLANGGADGPITVNIAPSPGVIVNAGGAEALVTSILLPVAGSLALSAVKPNLTHNLWTGGPTIEQVLADAHLIKKGATPAQDTLAALPSLTSIVSGLLQALAGSLKIPVSSTLDISLIDDAGTGGNRIGFALSGMQQFDVGSYTLTVHFGAPADWATGMDEGLGLYLFQAGGASLQFRPGLHCVGIGLGITGQGDSPLINTSQFRLGGVDAYTFFDVDFQGGISLSGFGAGLELDQFGIPLGQATGDGVGGNPVAAGLLQSGGAPGDNHPVNPGVDVSVWSVPTAIVPGPANDGNFHVRFGDTTDQPLWIPVHAGFGPIYIDQLGVNGTNDPGVQLLIDGSVKVDGLTAQANDLTVTIPFHSLTNPSGWSLDLGGLAVGFTAPGVTIAGGLLKNPGPPIEYDGMLLIQITQFGFVAVGAYSQPTDAQGKYTSLFVFAGIFVVVGLPPIIEIDGFGLGVGYNRELIVPDDLDQLPSFILIAALDDAGELANDPMGELMSIRNSIPARRGSFWLAVGLHGTSFVIVHVTAVVYVALDRGVEVGVLGVACMALPSDDTALVSIELALKARYSSSEGVLSIQAQLTDNSWILSPDCQLTGGFAYFMWFPQSQFVLTIGGYHPAFQKPPEFPDVPRLGYHWSLLGAINIKGESYFALTNTCVMAGARFEATYGPDCIHVWFTAYTDFLLSWDPFYYDISIGIGVGAAFHMQICFIGCVNIDITISLSASLEVKGPPLHGEVTVDLAVASVTVAFGPDPNPQPPFITDFGAFTLKYLYGNDPQGYAVATHVLTGLLAPEPPGGQPAPGTSAQPWRMGAEFSFQTESRMPATEEIDFVNGDSRQLGNVADIDLAPMGLSHPEVTTVHNVGIDQQQNDGSWQPAVIQKNHFTIAQVINQFSEATWHYIDHDNIPAAARTVPGLGGLQITGFALLANQSALIPIAKLIDVGYSRPLPFATLTTSYLDTLLTYGANADLLREIAAAAASNRTTSIASLVLSGSGFFSQARIASGIPATGLAPVAVNALQTGRSSPPVVAPITTGMTMRPVGLPRPPAIQGVAAVESIPLLEARLRAVLQARPQPVADAPVAFRTTVASVAAANGVVRMAPPQLNVITGASLQKIPAATAVRPTAIVRAAKTLRNFEAGWAAGAAHSAALKQAASDLTAAGVIVSAGATHVWDVPTGAATLLISGSAGARLTFLSRSGGVLDDREFVADSNGTMLAIPAGTTRFVAMCLGTPPTAANYGNGFGVISASAAPRSDVAATGWQSASMLMQAGASILLGRGASIRLPRPFTPFRSGLKTNQTVIRASEVMRDETATETSLPVATGVVMILLDQEDATAAAGGDLGIAADGATLATPPLRVEGGRRRALLYQVSQTTQGATSIVVSTASVTGWRVAGVVGLAGQAQEWAVRMNGGIPEHLVPQGPLTPNGQINVRLTSTTGGAA